MLAPLHRRLVGMRGTKHGRLLEGFPDQLQGNRQAGRAEARMREHIHFSQELVREHFKNQAVGFDTVVPLGAGRAKP